MKYKQVGSKEIGRREIEIAQRCVKEVPSPTTVSPPKSNLYFNSLSTCFSEYKSLLPVSFQEIGSPCQQGQWLWRLSPIVTQDWESFIE